MGFLQENAMKKIIAQCLDGGGGRVFMPEQISNLPAPFKYKMVFKLMACCCCSVVLTFVISNSLNIDGVIAFSIYIAILVGMRSLDSNMCTIDRSDNTWKSSFLKDG